MSKDPNLYIVVFNSFNRYIQTDHSGSQSHKVSLLLIEVASTDQVVPPDLVEDAFRRVLCRGESFQLVTGCCV